MIRNRPGVHQLQLAPTFAVVFIDLRDRDNVPHGMRLQSHVERNKVRRSAVAVTEDTLCMTRLDRESPGDFHSVQPVTRLRVAVTERPQLFIIGEEIITEILKIDGAVIGNAVDQIFLRNFRTDSFLEDPAEFGDVLLAETEILDLCNPSPTAIGCPP